MNVKKIIQALEKVVAESDEISLKIGDWSKEDVLDFSSYLAKYTGSATYDDVEGFSKILKEYAEKKIH